MLTLHVGTYTKDGGQGLAPMQVSAAGEISPGEPFAEAANASFGVRGNAPNAERQKGEAPPFPAPASSSPEPPLSPAITPC